MAMVGGSELPDILGQNVVGAIWEDLTKVLPLEDGIHEMFMAAGAAAADGGGITYAISCSLRTRYAANLRIPANVLGSPVSTV